MINGNKLVVILEYHDLVFCSSSLRISPVIYGYLDSLGTIFTWHVEDTAPWCVLIAA
jgi:hypothetical protein